MIRAYAVPDVRAAEAVAMAALPEGALMARAAAGLAQVAADRLRAREGSRVVALVGGGDNGGDTLYAVAQLAREGALATAVLADADAVHAAGLAAAQEAGVALAGENWAQALEAADLVLDGITGIGGRAGLREPARSWVEAIGDAAYVLAVDLPSGTDPEGRLGSAECVFADETVTFGAPKPGALLPATEPATGRLTVVDIGLDLRDALPAVERLTPEDATRLWPVPDASSDKYSRGVVGIVTGSTAYPGAGVLSVLGALGAGPGMVRYLGPPSVAVFVHRQAPEAVTANGRVEAYVLGSGVDPEDPDDADQLRWSGQALASDLPCVVDAGALAIVAPRSAPTVLTPHAGELARLLTRLGSGVEVARDDVLADPLGHARTAADLLGAVVLLKGSTTLVVPPSALGVPPRSQADAPAWLATAGAGDVLGGVVGTLLAAGLDPVDAASLAALVHGRAASRASGGGPVRAMDVALAIAPTIAELLRA